MKALSSLILSAACLFSAAAGAANAPEVDDAQKAAQSWLAVADPGNYASTWDGAAKLFQHGVSKEEWVKALSSLRPGLGQVNSRKLKSGQYSKSLPGLPDGDYVIVQYDTEFEKRAKSIETVTLLREADGAWRVAGYFIN
ncbi:DUF4019 domain-containing protein [Massilia sp. erpn]|uniref:DUF4019 domain-containing protein n=1 Tax=Massilia sp. erpn TaxID=2738142 RepID=UPI002107CE43|nr:DUF4019 domain-containing protein [Massilia sp. erpn]UTY56045.1 DUF4019 domain-containing protein [Massilia sp. erpn]